MNDNEENEARELLLLYAAAARSCLKLGRVTSARLADRLGVELSTARDLISLLEVDGFLNKVWIVQPDAVDKITGQRRLWIAEGFPTICSTEN